MTVSDQDVLLRNELVERIGRQLPVAVRAIIVGESDEDSIAVLAISGEIIAQRQRLRLGDGRRADVLVENVMSIERAIAGGKDLALVTILAQGTAALDDTGPVLAGLVDRAARALTRKPSDEMSVRFDVLGDLDRLHRELRRSARQPIMAQFAFVQLLSALMRARVMLAQRASTNGAGLFEACASVDPGLAAWVATSVRRPFSPELLSAVARKVEGVRAALEFDADGATQPTYVMADVLGGLALARQRGTQRAPIGRPAT
jgi:hypothetical protein